MKGQRRRAREAALQILYLWEVGGVEPLGAIDAYFGEHQPEAPESVTAFASSVVLGTIAELGEIDAVIEQHARHWRVARLAIIDRLILRAAIWELRHERETPAAVIINEAIELARRFSGEEAVRFVNGVLDGAAEAMGRREAAVSSDPDREPSGE